MALADYAIMMIINLFEVAVCPTCCCSSVLRRFLASGPAAGHRDTQFLQAQCVVADPAGVGTTGAQSTVMHDRRGETDHRLLIDYYKTNIDYEKTEFNIPSVNTTSHFFQKLEKIS